MDYKYIALFIVLFIFILSILFTYNKEHLNIPNEVAQNVDSIFSKNLRVKNMKITNGITGNKTLTAKNFYPVGSFYMSMSPTNPSEIFKFGTWTPVENRFLYCVDVKGSISSGVTGGSDKITIETMPPHSHTMTIPLYGSTKATNDRIDTGCCNGGYTGNVSETKTAWVSGGGNMGVIHSYYPPHTTCYCWYRSA